MDNSKLVSVIIPVYNVKSYLQEAVDSVINQTYKNLEIILIDDGSTDGSGELCDYFKELDKRVHVLHQENKGLSEARNHGLNLMTGEIVAFLDSDDKYQPTFIETMLSAMWQNNVDLVLCKSILLQTNGCLQMRGKEKPYPDIFQGQYDRADLLRAYSDSLIDPHVWNKIYKRSLWETVRFPAGRYYEDVATMFRILSITEKAYVVDEVLYVRRLRADSITSSFSYKNRGDYVWALSQFEKFIQDNIPEMFHYDQLQKIRQLKLQKMIVTFSMCFANRTNDIEKVELEKWRQRIIQLKKEVGIVSESRVLLAYYLIRLCPSLLRIIVPIYCNIRRTKRKIIVRLAALGV